MYIITRNKFGAEYVAIKIECEPAFEHDGFQFVSHKNPASPGEVDGRAWHEYHVSELETGFQLSAGSTIDEAIKMGKYVLSVNGPMLNKKMADAKYLIACHTWEFIDKTTTHETRISGDL